MTLFLILLTTSCIIPKGDSYLYASSFRGPSPLWHDPVMVKHSSNIIKSLHKLTGEELVPLELVDKDPITAAQRLFFLPNRVVVSAGIQASELGPVLNYGNSAALMLWSASWEQLTSMHGTYTAEKDVREDRQLFLDTVRKNGFCSGYSGVRISLDGRRFRIKDGTVWNIVIDDDFLGQAATFQQWEFL